MSIVSRKRVYLLPIFSITRYLLPYNTVRMARRRKSNAPLGSPTKDMSTTRRRNQQAPATNEGIPPCTRELDAGSALEKPSFEYRGKMTVSRAIAMVGIAAHSALPAIISWGLTMSLIFGGCCSNVGALWQTVQKHLANFGILGVCVGSYSPVSAEAIPCLHTC